MLWSSTRKYWSGVSTATNVAAGHLWVLLGGWYRRVGHSLAPFEPGGGGWGQGPVGVIRAARPLHVYSTSARTLTSSASWLISSGEAL